jgi:DNA-binding response OmpR family regulator
LEGGYIIKEGGMNILLIEDNSYTRLTIKVAIEKMGHKVIAEAENFEEAIEKINNSDYDIILLDILIPGGNGIDIIKHFGNINKKIIAITALEQDLIDKELKKLGVKSILRKPFSYDELERAIKEV